MFKVGDKAVYPAHGVGVIEKIEKKEIAGADYQFYMLRIIENDMTIMIPTANVDTVGLRRIIGTEQVTKVFRILKQNEISVDAATWNRRYREYMEKIKTGSAFEIAQVLRDLSILKNDKELSFGERKMLETARSLLVKELALSKDQTEEQIARQLDKILSKTAEEAAENGTKRRKSKPASKPINLANAGAAPKSAKKSLSSIKTDSTAKLTKSGTKSSSSKSSGSKSKSSPAKKSTSAAKPKSESKTTSKKVAAKRAGA